MSGGKLPPSEGSIRRLSAVMLGTIALLVGVMGGLAATTEISGAVIAPGTLAVDSYVKPIQHLKGGLSPPFKSRTVTVSMLASF